LSSSLIAQDFREYKGEIVDVKTNNVLEYVTLTVENTNITTVTNREGEFLLKVPNTNTNATLKVSLLGYNTQRLPLNGFANAFIKIKLQPATVNLSQVNISSFKSAEGLVRKVFENKRNTQADESLLMTTFYRETIKRRNRNISLTEAVLNVLKQPYTDSRPDAIKLHKARKSTDYKRLDTLTLKLQGGPFSTLYIDTMKYPEYIFTDGTITGYEFSFGTQTTIDGKNVQVVNFKPKFKTLNIGYYGNLYIDTSNLALVSLDYEMDLSNKAKVRNMLVKKKPRDVVVIPMQAHYKIDYKSKNGKWYYSYSNFMLKFKLNKKRKWFNKIYTLSSEMAVTDWDSNADKKNFKAKERLKPSVIIADAISGFSDPDFWGEYNLIEPDRSIESAIKKIQKNLKRSQI
jgi:hypothetical protein